MKIREGFLLREVGGGHIVIPVGEQSKQFRGMITLNETGAFLWEYFMKESAKEGAVAALCERYDVDFRQAEQDVIEFFNLLQAHNFLR